MCWCALQVAGTSGKVHIDGDSDDEGISSEEHGSAIIEALGWERRNEVSVFLLPLAEQRMLKTSLRRSGNDACAGVSPESRSYFWHAWS